MSKKKSEPSLLAGWGAAIIMIGILVCCMHATKQQQKRQQVFEDGQFKSRPLSERLAMLSLWSERLQKEELYTEEEEFWDTVLGASWLHVQSKQLYKQPVIIALVGYNEEHLLARAIKVGTGYSTVFSKNDAVGLTQISGEVYKNKSVSAAKLDIDKKLIAGFSSGLKVAVITNLDKIPPCSVMLFHSYCDGENAPYKDTVIIFTIVLTQRLTPSDHDITDDLHRHMANVWATCPSELRPSKIVAMQSRLLNNVAHVK